MGLWHIRSPWPHGRNRTGWAVKDRDRVLVSVSFCPLRAASPPSVLTPQLPTAILAPVLTAALKGCRGPRQQMGRTSQTAGLISDADLHEGQLPPGGTGFSDLPSQKGSVFNPSGSQALK